MSVLEPSTDHAVQFRSEEVKVRYAHSYRCPFHLLIAVLPGCCVLRSKSHGCGLRYQRMHHLPGHSHGCLPH